MKSTKTMVFVAAVLLALSGLCLLPSVAGQGRERSLEQRVTVLEAQVTELIERIDQIEGRSCSCTTLNLQPLDYFPDNPSEGDLCVVDLPPTSEPGAFYGPTLFTYLNGEWLKILSTNENDIEI